MSKSIRVILIGSAILALVTLAGLSVKAFSQGNAEAGSASLDLAFQEQPAGRAARPFIQERQRENLAQALGISPEELDEARWAAHLATLADAVEEGHLAQQAADRLLARAVVRQMASRDELIAAGVGITVDELPAAREEGKTARQLVDELGLDATAIGQNLAAFLEDLFLQAARDGLISDEQAQRILDDELLDRLAQGLWRPWSRLHRPANPGGRR